MSITYRENQTYSGIAVSYETPLPVTIRPPADGADAGSSTIEETQTATSPDDLSASSDQIMRGMFKAQLQTNALLGAVLSELYRIRLVSAEGLEVRGDLDAVSAPGLPQ